MIWQRLTLGIIAAVALGIGLMRSPGPSESGGIRAGASADRESAAASIRSGRAEGTAGPTARWQSRAEPHQPTLFVASIDSPELLENESWNGEPPIDLGEPLDADNLWAWEAAQAGEYPIDIGPQLDADDPLTSALDETSGPPRAIGEPLDADDPGSWDSAMALDDPIDIGPTLDADDPHGFGLD